MSDETVFFSVPLSKLEPIFKRWIKEAQTEIQSLKVEPINPPERLLTIKEAAELLSLSVPTLYSKVSRGELPSMKHGKRLYFSSIELSQCIKAGRKRANNEIEQEADTYLSNNKKGLNNGK